MLRMRPGRQTPWSCAPTGSWRIGAARRMDRRRTARGSDGRRRPIWCLSRACTNPGSEIASNRKLRRAASAAITSRGQRSTHGASNTAISTSRPPIGTRNQPESPKSVKSLNSRLTENRQVRRPPRSPPGREKSSRAQSQCRRPRAAWRGVEAATRPAVTGAAEEWRRAKPGRW